MGMFREFLAWRRNQKQLELLRNSWTRPHENHPFTPETTCYTPTKHTMKMFDSDVDYLKSVLDTYGPKNKPTFPFKITMDNCSMVRPEFEAAIE